MLLDAVGDRLRRKTLHGVMRLQSSQGRHRAQLLEIGAVLIEEVCEDGGWKLDLKMAERDLQRFLKRENLADNLLEPLSVAQSATAVNLK